MEAFTLLKFWHIPPGNLPADDSDGDSDSFFDLDLNLPPNNHNNNSSDTDDDRFYELESPNSKPHSPISFFRSPAKFPVFMLFKKPQSETKQQSKRFGPEEVPISSLLSRAGSCGDRKLRRQASNGSSSKRFVVQKYLKLIKPLYVRVSKRYSDKMNFSFYDSSSSTAASPSSSPAPPAPRRSEERSRVTQLRSVTKHLGKCRSASSAVGMVQPTVISRRDDSLLDDGIQSAILHCKRSYDAKRDLSMLSRCTSDPCYYEISIQPYRRSTGEGMKRSSI